MNIRPIRLIRVRKLSYRYRVRFKVVLVLSVLFFSYRHRVRQGG